MTPCQPNPSSDVATQPTIDVMNRHLSAPLHHEHPSNTIIYKYIQIECYTQNRIRSISITSPAQQTLPATTCTLCPRPQPRPRARLGLRVSIRSFCHILLALPETQKPDSSGPFFLRLCSSLGCLHGSRLGGLSSSWLVVFSSGLDHATHQDCSSAPSAPTSYQKS